MTSQTGTQKITVNVLPGISKSKGNQKMKFGKLKEFNARNIFLQISCRNCGRKTSFRPFFFKKKKFSMKQKQVVST